MLLVFSFIACFWLVISDVFARLSNVFHSVDSTNMMSLPSSSSYINTGSIPEQDGDRIYNTCTVYGPNGDLLTTYRKVYNIVIYSIVVYNIVVYNIIIIVDSM